MSYSRWGDSVWYAFYNTQDDLSLWHVQATLDWTYEELRNLKSDSTQTLALIMEEYGCSLSEAKEALVYINQFIEDYENDHKQDA